MSAQDRMKTIYGCDINEFIASVEDSLTFRTSGPGMIVMSILSDVQELMSLGGASYLEQARQYLNRAKYMIDHYKLGLTVRE